MQPPWQTTLNPVLIDASEDGKLPGVVALLTDGEDTRYVHASGVRDTNTGTPMTADTVFWIASMTKLVTITAALRLLEQGRLSLDEPASRWFADLSHAQVLQGFDTSGQPQLRAPARPVTLRHLLTHTSGYAYEFFNADILRFQKATGTPSTSTCLHAAFQNPLVFDPGERWHYGMGIDAVGRILENVSGQSLGETLREHVLEPLGMTDTAFRLSPSMLKRRASVHMRADTLKPIGMVVPQTPEFEMGGGGLYSTATDYAQLLRLILNRGRHRGKRVLQEDTVALLLQNAIGNLPIAPLSSAMAHLSHTADFYPDTPKTWSFGGLINQAPLSSGRAAGSLMWAGLANTYFWVDPSRKLAGVFLAQVLPFADPAVLAALDAFETQAYRALASSR